jgi:hypothetical protein
MGVEDLVMIGSLMVVSFMMGMLFESINSFKKRMKELSEQ